MAELRVTWNGRADLDLFEEAARILGSKRVAQIGAMAVNRAGDQARTKVRQALPKQTGLKRSVIVKAVRSAKASAGTLRYQMQSEGGDVALKYFAARETRAGVSAAPFGQRRVFGGDFIKGGRFPSRTDIGMGGHVFRREGGERFPIERQKSGVIIPNEMIKGATADAFTTTVADVLPRRIAHEIKRATKGAVT